jgi:hypothetical protein
MIQLMLILNKWYFSKFVVCCNLFSSCCANSVPLFRPRLSFRHRNSWQDAGRIKLHRADLIRFIYEITVKMKVQFETPPPRRLLYHGGSLAQGQVIDFKRNLLIADNILNYNGGHATDDVSILKSRPSNVSRDYSSNEPILPGD